MVFLRALLPSTPAVTVLFVSTKAISQQFLLHCCLSLNHKNDEANSCCTFVLVAADGGTESSALVDDNGSEEDYSYEELCQAAPRYLQPGGEQLAINEVMSGAFIAGMMTQGGQGWGRGECGGMFSIV